MSLTAEAEYASNACDLNHKSGWLIAPHHQHRRITL